MLTQSQMISQSSLATLDAHLASRVKDQIEMLKNRGAKNGARRLDDVMQHFEHYTVEGASQHIRKDDIIDELEDQPRGGFGIALSVLRFLRNVFSILPIVITWLALFFAANAYQNDLATTRDDVYQPFLLLWQEGFHGRILPFSEAAFWDFIFLSGLIVSIILIPILERWRLNRLHASLEAFDTTIDDLLAEIGQAGADAHLADSDVAKLSGIIKDAIEQTLGHLMLKYDQVAENALKQVKSANESTKLLVKHFDDNLVTFHGDVKLLSDDLQIVDQNINGYGQQIRELSEASNKLVGSSNDLASNAKSLAESANLNVRASEGISERLSDLNVAQQEIIKAQKDVVQGLATTQKQMVTDVTTSQQSVVQTIAESQKEVVEQLTGAADQVERSGKNTRDVANNLGQVAKNLEQLTRADFQSMTDGVKKANQDLVDEVQKTSNGVQLVIQGLSQIGTQLQQTTRELNDAASKFNATSAQAQVPAGPFAGKKLVFTSIAVAALAIIGELAVLVMHSL